MLSQFKLQGAQALERGETYSPSTIGVFLVFSPVRRWAGDVPDSGGTGIVFIGAGDIGRRLTTLCDGPSVVEELLVAEIPLAFMTVELPLALAQQVRATLLQLFRQRYGGAPLAQDIGVEESYTAGSGDEAAGAGVLDLHHAAVA